MALASTYILQSLNANPPPPPSPLTSLVFRIPFPENFLDRLCERYSTLRKEQHQENEGHFELSAARLALEAYTEESIAADREHWVVCAKSTFDTLVTAHKDTLRHVELLLPTGGIATPLNLFESLKELTQLESLCVQWPMRGYHPVSLILSSSFLEVSEAAILPSFEQFHAALMDLLAVHATTLKRVRISLPESSPLKPFSALSFRAGAFPSLPALEILDLTHWSPSIAQLVTLLSPGGRLPHLQHLILDHGAEIPLTDEVDDGDEEVPPDYDWSAPVPPLVETHSWPALGAFIANATPPLQLRSLSAALHDGRWNFAPIGVPLTRRWLRELLAMPDSYTPPLVICTAWPLAYEARESKVDPQQTETEEMFEHASGCGHLAYPSDQRPTPGLWPAQSAQARATQMLSGRPWY